MAKAILLQCGFRSIEEKVKKSCGVEVNFEALDQLGRKWVFDVSGAFSVTQRPGLRRTDTLWKALGKAAVLHSVEPDTPVVLLTTDRPALNSAGAPCSQIAQRARQTGPSCHPHALTHDDLQQLAALARGEC